jgi:hypothetical protein
MKIMFNNLDRLFELSNIRYEHEACEFLCFVKHHNLTQVHISYVGKKYSFHAFYETYFNGILMAQTYSI